MVLRYTYNTVIFPNKLSVENYMSMFFFQYGRAPIHWASSRGNTDIMEMLIAGNCDTEARDKVCIRII